MGTVAVNTNSQIAMGKNMEMANPIAANRRIATSIIIALGCWASPKMVQQATTRQTKLLLPDGVFADCWIYDIGLRG